MPPEIKEVAKEQTLRGITPVPKTCQNGHQHLKFYPSVPEMPLFGHGVSGIEDVAVDEALRHPSRAVMLLIYSAGLQEFAVAHGEGAVAEGGEGRVVCDDDDCLAEGVAEAEE